MQAMWENYVGEHDLCHPPGAVLDFCLETHKQPRTTLYSAKCSNDKLFSSLLPLLGFDIFIDSFD